MKTQSLTVLAYLVLALYGLMGGVYYLHLFPDGLSPTLLGYVNRFEGMICLMGPLFYLMLWLQYRSLPTQAAPPPQEGKLTLGYVGCFGLGLVALGFFRLSLWGIPAGMLLTLLGGYGMARGMAIAPQWGIQNPKQKVETPLGFNLKLINGWINLSNPFRGILVIGAAGSGKSYSIAEPVLEQAVAKGYTGILYDFKFPTLSNLVYTQYGKHPQGVQLRVVNFKDLSRSHRVNPIKPDNMPMVAYAEEYAQAVMSNLRPDTIAKKDYWISSASKIFSATIWYMKKHHPALCTLPHIVALICHKGFKSLLALLEQDLETAPLIADMSVAVELGADKQVAGVIGTLQNALSSLNTPEIFWVMTGDDFELDLNHPQAKTFLCVGTDPTLSQTYAPVVACIVTVALKLMNQPHRQHSICLLDEAPTIFIPKFDQIPATARSNKIATVYMAQDLSQMVQSYGETNSEVILGNLNNQFFGKVANQRTADYVAKMVGKEEKELISKGQSISRGHSQSSAQSQTHSYQERDLVRPQEVMNQHVGEFTGLTVGEQGNEWFKGQIQRGQLEEVLEMPAFSQGVDAQAQFVKVHQEAAALLAQIHLPSTPSSHES